MPTYIRLSKLTKEGFERVDESTTRTEQMKGMASEMGGTIKSVYMTFGEYDFITIAEFPNDEMYAQFAMRIASDGHVETKTLKALNEMEYIDVIEELD